MDGDEGWARCTECQTERKQTDMKCPKCGSTMKAYDRKGLVKVGNTISKAKTKQKRKGFNNPIRQMISRWESSRDPRLKNGVQKQMTINQEKDEYHQVVKDAKTGEILHEEHEPLSQHKKDPSHPTSAP